MSNSSSGTHWSEQIQTIKPTDLPSHLLRAAYLIGKIPFRACRSDPRISYTLYIPDSYQKIHSALRKPDPEQLPTRMPLLINIHSTRRDAVSCRDSLISFAYQHDIAILAPLFPAALENPFDLDSYKVLRTRGGNGSFQADLRLLDILNEINHIWPGISTDPVFLMGFSGGAQFVNRFAYLYPERLRGVVIAAPGKVTRLSSDQRWPDGVADVSAIFEGMEVEMERLKEEISGNVLMVVGGEDVMGEDTMELKDFLAGRKKSDGENRPRTSRVEGLKELRNDWGKHGIEVDFEVVDGVGHDYAGLLPVILKWLEEKVKGGIS